MVNLFLLNAYVRNKLEQVNQSCAYITPSVGKSTKLGTNVEGNVTAGKPADRGTELSPPVRHKT